MSLTERLIVLKSIRYIDEIAVYESEEDLKNLLRLYRPDVRFLGDEYSTKYVGADLSTSTTP